MSAYRHHPAAGKRHSPPSLDRPGTYYVRIQAAKRMADGWTLEQATGRYSEYGWLWSLDKTPKRPLATLVTAEAGIRARNALIPPQLHPVFEQLFAPFRRAAA